MPHITLEAHLPGITGLLEYHQEAGKPIRDLTQLLLRGPSTLSEADRELIATVVSNQNQCTFCTTAHTAAASLYLGEKETAEAVKNDLLNAPITPKLKALLNIAIKVAESGKSVTQAIINEAKTAGATDLEIHDTVLIAALFCLYNRYVDGLATALPAQPNYYDGLAEVLVKEGYMRSPTRYDSLKKAEEI
jgi:uncharacterized peroxidase-related enzyme